MASLVPAPGSSVSKIYSNKKITVATPSHEYEEMAEHWELPEDLMGGTLEMREEKTKWLPQEPKETLAAYTNRLNRTVLYEAYPRTISALAGIPFMRSAVIENLPTELEYLNEDCDNELNDITSFSHDILKSAIHFGISHFLVEMPYFEQQPTKEQEQLYKIRPYFCPVTPTNLIAWRTEQVGGLKYLSEVRIKEEVYIPDDEWGEKEVERIRVYRPNEVLLYTADDEGNYSDVPDEIRPNNLGYIPLVTVYGNRTEFMQGTPCLEGLAWLNLRHYQKLSDQDNIEHYVNVPMMFGAGFQDGELQGAEIGAARAISSTNENAKLGYVEHSGQAIGATRESIKDLEQRMAAMGADLLQKSRPDRQTATARVIDQSESLSLLQIIVNRTESAIEQGIKIAADWLKMDTSSVNAVVNIGDSLDQADGPNTQDIILNYLIANKGITLEQAVSEAKRRGMLSDTFELEEPKDSIPNSIPDETANTEVL